MKAFQSITRIVALSCLGLFFFGFANPLAAQCPGAGVDCNGDYSSVVLCEVSGDSGQSDGCNDAIVEICGVPGTDIGCMVISNSEWAVVLPTGTTIPADGVFLIACSEDPNGSCGIGGSFSANGQEAAGEGDYNVGFAAAEIDFDVCDPANANYYDPAATGFTLDNANPSDGDAVVLFQPDGTVHDAVAWGAPGAVGNTDNCTIQSGPYTLGDNDGNGIINDNLAAATGARCDGTNSTGVPFMPAGDCGADMVCYTMPPLTDAVYTIIPGDAFQGCNSSYIRLDPGSTQGGTDGSPSHADGSYTDQPVDANGNPTAVGTTTMESFTAGAYTPSACGDNAAQWAYTDHPTPGQPNDEPTFAFYVSNAIQCTPGDVIFTVEVYNWQHVEDGISTIKPSGSVGSGSFVDDPIAGSEQPWVVSSIVGETTTFTYTQTTPGPGLYTFNLVWDDFTACCGSSFPKFGNECHESQEIVVEVIEPMTEAPTFTCEDGRVVVTTIPDDATGITYELLDGTSVVSSNETGQFLVTTDPVDNYTIRVSQKGDCSGPYTAVGTVCVFAPPCPAFTDYADCTTEEGDFCPGATIDIAVDGTDLTPGALIEFVSLATGDTDPYDNPASDVLASCIVPDPTIEITGDYGGASGNFFAYQDIDGVLSSASQTMTIAGLNIFGQTGLSLCIDLAEDSPYNSWEGTNTFQIDIDIDGGGPVSVLTVDDNTGTTALATDISGAVDITSTFQTYTSSIAGTGANAIITITMDANAGNEDLGFDNLILKSNETPGGIYNLDFDTNNSGYVLSDIQTSNGTDDYFGVVSEDAGGCKSISVSVELCGDLNIAPRINPAQVGCNMTTGGDSETPTLDPLTFTIACPEASIEAAAIDVCEDDMAAVDIPVTITGGVGDYEIVYAINGTAQPAVTIASGGNISIPGPTDGEVKVTLVSVTDNGGSMCSGSVNDAEICVNIRPNEELTITGSVSPTTCMPCDGTVTFDVTSGTSSNSFDIDYTFNGTLLSLASVSMPFTLTGACPGVYEIVGATDDFGCTQTVVGNEQTLNAPTGTPVSVTTAPAAICGTDGSEVDLAAITYDPVYAAADFTFFTVDPNSLPAAALSSTPPMLASTTVTPTATTTYWVRYTDPATGCESLTTVTVTIDNDLCFDCPEVSSPSADQSVCLGTTLGDVTANVDVNTSMFQFVYFTTAQTGSAMYTGGTAIGTAQSPAGAATPYTITAAAANLPTAVGTYYVYAIVSPTPGAPNTDCRPFVEIEIEILPLATADVSDGGTVDEDGDGDPHTEEFCTSGTPAATFDVLTGTNGIVTSVVTGANISGGVTAVNTIIADGALIETGTLSISGTTAQTVEYTICPYNSGPDGDDDSATGDDCLATTVLNTPDATTTQNCVTHTVTVNPLPSVELAPTAPTCDDFDLGSIAVTSNSGVSMPATYSWSNGSSGTSVQSISGLTAGTYMLTVTDNNMCSATFSSTVPAADGCVFDVALDKVISTMSPYVAGQNVTFTITVYNQGTVDAYNIDVVDYVPAGLIFNAADNTTVPNNWVTNAAGDPEHTIATLAAGGSVAITIVLQIDPAITAFTSIVNEAEIIDAENKGGDHPEDEDSPLGDTEPDPDDETDDDTDDDAAGGDNDTDEDDFDFAGLDLCPVITATLTGDVTNCNDGAADLTVTITGGAADYTITYTDGTTATTITTSTAVTDIPVTVTATTTYTLMSITDANGCPVTNSGSATVTLNKTNCSNFPWDGNE